MQEVRELSPGVKELIGQLLLMGPPLLVLSGLLAGVSFALGPFVKILGWILGLGGAVAALGNSTAFVALGVFFLDLAAWAATAAAAVVSLPGLLLVAIAALIAAGVYYWDSIYVYLSGIWMKLADLAHSAFPDWITRLESRTSDWFTTATS